MSRRPARLADSVLYDDVLRRKKEFLTPDPNDPKSRRYLELRPRVQALYNRNACADLCNAIAGAMWNPKAEATSEEATVPFNRHLIKHSKWDHSLAAIGNYLEFNEKNPDFHSSDEQFAALVWIDTNNKEENLIAKLFCKITIDRINEDLLVVSFRSPISGIVFRHLIVPQIEAFDFNRDPTFRIAEYTAYELDNGVPLRVTLLFVDSIALKKWAKAASALNPQEDTEDEEDEEEEGEEKADDNCSTHSNPSESQADDTISVGSAGRIGDLSTVLAADFEQLAVE